MPTTTPFQNLITFSRGSNATVTGPNGLIQWAPSNLLTFSEQFDNAAWTKTGATISANFATAPDGTLTADKLVETATTGSHQAYSGVFSSVIGTVTYSLRVKAAERSWIFVADNTGGVYFNVANGTVGTASGGRTGSITAAGNGFYVCAVTGTWSGTQQIYFVAATGDGVSSYTGTAGSGLLIWGAQLELGSTATTYNPTTVKNLLGFSEAFDNAAWTKLDASIVTGAQANPVNGLFNAQKLMENTTNAQHLVQQGFSVTSGTPYVFSVYAKAAGRNRFSLRLGSIAPADNVTFDLSNGTIVTGSAGYVASIVSVGSGWYRCSITSTPSSSGTRQHQIYLNSGSGSGVETYTGDGSSGVYIYGAQLSDSASLDPYVPTPGAAPSSTAYYGPRFDYDPVTRQPKGILIEEARTNLLTYSEQFDNAAWTKTNATVAANDIAAPDGITTADALVEDTTLGNHMLRSAATVGSAAQHTASCYLRAGTRSWAALNFNGEGNAFAYYNLSGNGAVGQTGSGAVASIVNVGNGWYRLTLTFTLTAARALEIIATPGDGSTSYAGVAGAKAIYVWGAQLEAGAFATSYIPTIASTVTRSADVATITGSLFSQWYRQDQGAFVAEATTFKPTTVSAGSFFVVNASDGTTSEQASIRVSSANIGGLVWDGGVLQAGMDTAYAVNSVEKCALALRANDFAFVRNGASPLTDTSGTMPTVSRLSVGVNAAASSEQLNGHIRSIRFIPFRSADFQLQAIST